MTKENQFGSDRLNAEQKSDRWDGRDARCGDLPGEGMFGGETTVGGGEFTAAGHDGMPVGQRVAKDGVQPLSAGLPIQTVGEQ